MAAIIVTNLSKEPQMPIPTNAFEFTFNDEQIACLEQVTTFIAANKPFSRLLINGSAGTGKTSIIISGVITFMLKKIAIDIEQIMNAVEQRKFNLLDTLPNFIIAAPTNKAKDVLIAKYDTLIDKVFPNERGNELFAVIKVVLKRKIVFLTVSQILGISRTINELGEEEFTKGNEAKITKKYSDKAYVYTRIVIDECSMIDTNIFKLLKVIKCSTVFIGDYCQLPPVNEILSPTFTLENDISSIVIKLTKVERCTNAITGIANKLRDRIYAVISEFNLLKLAKDVEEIKIYNKDFMEWIEKYSNSIKERQRELYLAINDGGDETTAIVPTIGKSTHKLQIKYDNMALGWTNKCCSLINRKIREMLYIEEDFDIDEHFIVKGDKLFVKNNYFKYNAAIKPSSIFYVANFSKVQYKPLSFSEWLDTLNKIAEYKKMKGDANGGVKMPIDLNAILDQQLKKVQKYLNPIQKQGESKSITDFFPTVLEDNDKLEVNEDSAAEQIKKKERQIELEQAEQVQKLRCEFFVVHNLADVILEGLYEFNDNVSVAFPNIIKTASIYTIKNLPRGVRHLAYTDWHKRVSAELFGIPLDRIHCRKCEFFAAKFAASQFRDCCYIKDMMQATTNIMLDIYLCDLATYGLKGVESYNRIPVLNQQSGTNANSESINSIKAIIKNSFEVKLQLSKQEERELRGINVLMGEEELNEGGANTGIDVGNGFSDDSNSRPPAYITMSQMLGHYFSHMFNSVYLDVDYGYALTVHKSQGSTYNDVYVEYGNILSNRKNSEKNNLLYTAITRCANNLHVYY